MNGKKYLTLLLDPEEADWLAAFYLETESEKIKNILDDNNWNDYNRLRITKEDSEFLLEEITKIKNATKPEDMDKYKKIKDIIDQDNEFGCDYRLANSILLKLEKIVKK